ncbi:hypothetical protein V6N11_050238 [Hibiscus sabdariffa]|uniref:Uncharacterized protein n=2 Tax=Hibiscus sabdariffa TaxID=183260 RepID=A0ABR2T996_9ROSI
MIRQNPNSTSLAIQDSNDRTIRVDQAARDFAIEWREVASLGLFWRLGDQVVREFVISSKAFKEYLLLIKELTLFPQPQFLVYHG